MKKNQRTTILGEISVLAVWMILFLLCNIAAFGQQALINQLAEKYPAAVSETSRLVKCGLPQFASAHAQHPQETKALYRNYQRQNSARVKDVYISPSGRFEIFYTASSIPTYDRNSDGTPDYLEFVGKAFDRAWFVEIDSLGFSPPPDENGIPRATYRVTCTNLGNSLYGVTYFDEDIPQLPGYNAVSEIEINTHFEFVNYPAANGDPIVRDSMAIAVTAAHEFNHALQLGYRFWYNSNQNFRDLRLIEGTATYMEEVVADEVNDYYFYLDDFYNAFNGKTWEDDNQSLLYGDVVFYIMIGELYGKQIVREIWEEVRNVPGTLAANNVLASLHNSSLTEELRRLLVWMYFSGSRAISGNFFEEAANYPDPAVVDFLPVELRSDPVTLTEQSMPPLAIQLLRVPVVSLIDTAKVLLQSVDAPGRWAGVWLSPINQSFQLFEEGEPLDIALLPPESDVYIGIISKNWSDDYTQLSLYRLRMSVSKGSATDEIIAFPNIIRPGKGVKKVQFVNLPPEAVIAIFSANGASIAKVTTNPSGKTATWDLKNTQGNEVGSGVYIYRVQSSSKSASGKIMIIR